MLRLEHVGEARCLPDERQFVRLGLWPLMITLVHLRTFPASLTSASEDDGGSVLMKAAWRGEAEDDPDRNSNSISVAMSAACAHVGYASKSTSVRRKIV